MTEKEIYIEIAKRFILNCNESLTKGIDIQEAIGFNLYHAFESIGGAVNCHLGHRVPLAHQRKIDTFAFNYRRNTISRIRPQTIGTLAITLSNLRNKFLYPETTPNGLVCPKDQLSMANIRQLTSQINGIINQLSINMV
jgi:hypothetical protein